MVRRTSQGRSLHDWLLLTKTKQTNQQTQNKRNTPLQPTSHQLTHKVKMKDALKSLQQSDKQKVKTNSALQRHVPQFYTSLINILIIKENRAGKQSCFKKMANFRVCICNRKTCSKIQHCEN